MGKEPDQRRDRYDVSGNVEAEYVDAEKTVLENKLGIADLHTLQIAEEEALAQAYEALLAEVRTDTPMTCDLVCHIHLRIFGDLYQWAGRWRTVWISKPGVTWPAPDFLDSNMQDFESGVLSKYPAHAFRTTMPSLPRSVKSKGSSWSFIRSGRETPERSNCSPTCWQRRPAGRC